MKSVNKYGFRKYKTIPIVFRLYDSITEIRKKKKSNKIGNNNCSAGSTNFVHSSLMNFINYAFQCAIMLHSNWGLVLITIIR